MLRSISRELSARGIQLVLLMAQSPRGYQIASRYLRSGHVDGAVLVSMHGKGRWICTASGCPWCLPGSRHDDDLSYVDAGNVGGARMAVRCLLKHGRGTVATVAGPPDMSPGEDRLHGYRLNMAEAGLSDSGLSDSGLIVFGDFGRVSAEHAVYRLLDRGPGLDAVFVASDLMAAGALRALRRSGRRVPDGVAVIGFEDSPLAMAHRPEADHRAPAGGGHGRAVRQRTARADRAGGGQEPVHVVFETELVIRESA